MPRKRRPPRPGALQDLSPLRLLSQIVLLQVLYYVTAALLLLFTALVAGQKPQLDLLLSWRTVRGDTTFGWTLALVWMLDSLIWCDLFPSDSTGRNDLRRAKRGIPPPAHRALQTRPRLRLHNNIPKPHHHLALRALYSILPRLVGTASREHSVDDVSWCLGLSV